MAITGATIGPVVEGDDYDVIEPTIEGVPAGQTITKAWLTLKNIATDADPGIVQKVITTTLTADGQITDDGATDGIAALLFHLTPTETRLIYTTRPTTHDLLFDIQVMTSASKIYTYKIGTISAIQEITIATS